jgi:hypothetical protein
MAMGESAGEKTRRDVRPEALARGSAGLTRKPSQRFPELAHRQRREQLSYEPRVLLDDALVDPESRRKPRRAVTVADGPRFSRPRMKTPPGGFPHENVAQWDYSVVMQPETSEVGDVWRMIETALARRQEAFTLSHLMWSDDGYTVKFRQGPVNIVRTTIAAGVFGDEAGLNKLLDGVRSDFRVLDPWRGGPH